MMICFQRSTVGIWGFPVSHQEKHPQRVLSQSQVAQSACDMASSRETPSIAQSIGSGKIGPVGQTIESRL